MAIFLAVPIAIAVIGLLCLDVKIGFMVSEATENTGFDMGFYMMTVIGLIVAEVCAVVWLFS
jgi:hypothetical protein